MIKPLFVFVAMLSIYFGGKAFYDVYRMSPADAYSLVSRVNADTLAYERRK